MAILADFSGIACAALFSQGTDKIDETLVRHLILNSLRMYNVKYRKEYGQMVLCCDGGQNWRRDIYPQYKQKRRESRESIEEDKNAVDWDEFFRVLNKVRDEIKENVPWKVIHVQGTEADDAIGTIVRSTQEFGQHDDIMIVSSDHDFIQLQQFDNVAQFSPATKKLVKESHPVKYAFTQILKGCGGDGVPNILSDDNVFLVEDARQTPMTSKKIELLWEAKKNGNLQTELQKMGADVRYGRNLAMVDLIEQNAMPIDLKNEIMRQYALPSAPASKTFNYLIKNRCNMLISSVSEFFPQ